MLIQQSKAKLNQPETTSCKPWLCLSWNRHWCFLPKYMWIPSNLAVSICVVNLYCLFLGFWNDIDKFYYSQTLSFILKHSKNFIFNSRAQEVDPQKLEWPTNHKIVQLFPLTQALTLTTTKESTAHWKLNKTSCSLAI